MAVSQSSITLNSGAKMPLMGFGTLLDNTDPVGTVETAIEVGYRHLDTASVYRTEQAVGQAVNNKIKQGVISREDVFITTKLWRTSYRQQDVVPAFKTSLQKLGMAYVDLFLVHWPTAFQPGDDFFPKKDGKFVYADIDYLETWKGMEECADIGLARSIGISNFNSQQITRILDNCRIRPANHQIESHPFLTNSKIVQFCRDKGISVTAYAPLAGFNPKYREECGWPTIFTDQTIAGIATKHKKTPAQVALRYQLQRGVAVVPKSDSKSRMQENFQATDFDLTPEDIAAVEACGCNMRLNAELPDHKYYPFTIDF